MGFRNCAIGGEGEENNFFLLFCIKCSKTFSRVRVRCQLGNLKRVTCLASTKDLLYTNSEAAVPALKRGQSEALLLERLVSVLKFTRVLGLGSACCESARCF